MLLHNIISDFNYHFSISFQHSFGSVTYLVFVDVHHRLKIGQFCKMTVDFRRTGHFVSVLKISGGKKRVKDTAFYSYIYFIATYQVTFDPFVIKEHTFGKEHTTTQTRLVTNQYIYIY